MFDRNITITSSVINTSGPVANVGDSAASNNEHPPPKWRWWRIAIAVVSAAALIACALIAPEQMGLVLSTIRQLG